MGKVRSFLLAAVLLPGLAMVFVFGQTLPYEDDRFVSYVADAKKQAIKLYWRDDQQGRFKSIGKLKTWLDERHQTLMFAMN